MNLDNFTGIKWTQMANC